MSKFSDFNQSVTSALNTMYTTHSRTTVTLYNPDIGIRVEIHNVAAEEISEIQRLLDEHPEWARTLIPTEPVGNQKLQEATAEACQHLNTRPTQNHEEDICLDCGETL